LSLFRLSLLLPLNPHLKTLEQLLDVTRTERE
jgi:hypothetical protein